MDMREYVYPELLFLVPFLNLTGWWIKHKTRLSNRFIPIVLGIVAMVLSSFYIYATMGETFSDSVLKGILQGVFLASTAVYANQLTKTVENDKEE